LEFFEDDMPDERAIEGLLLDEIIGIIMMALATEDVSVV
jgi:hypothetical protein